MALTMLSKETRIIGLLSAVLILATVGFLIKSSLDIFFDYADGKTSANVVKSGVLISESAFQNSSDNSIRQSSAKVISRISALRNDADENAPLIANLIQNTAVEFLKSHGDWIYIKTQSGMLGWVKRDTLKVENESASETAVTPDADPHSLPKFPNGSFQRLIRDD